MSHVESGRPLIGFGIKWVLRQRLQNCPRVRRQSAQDGAGVVNRLRKGITRLQAQSDPRIILAEASLQCVVARVRPSGHDRLRAKTSGRVARGIERCERSERRIGAGVTVRRVNAREADSRRAYIRCCELDTVKVLIDSCRPGANVSVAEIARDDSGAEQLDFMPS